MSSRDVVAASRRMVWLTSNTMSLGGLSEEVGSAVGVVPDPLSTSVSCSPDPTVIYRLHGCKFGDVKALSHGIK